MEIKSEVRKRMLKTRAALKPSERLKMSKVIQERVIGSPDFITSCNILLYMDYHEEVQTGLLLQTCFLHHKKVGIPKIQGSTMEFYELLRPGDVRPGFHQILEPLSEQVFQPEQALVIVPGVAFSMHKMRIGYGKGFYDQYLNGRDQLKTCGIAFSCQIVEQFQTEKHDVPLDRIITETIIV